MDFELKHLGQTLAIGGFAIYAILYLLRTCRERWVPQFFCIQNNRINRPRGKSSNIKLEHTAIYLALVLAAGIVVEDLSKNIVSGRDDPLPTDPGLSENIGKSFKELLNNSVLDKDSELRLRSLFSIGSQAQVDPLAKEGTEKKEFIRFRPRGIFWEMTELINRFPDSVGAKRAKAVLRLMEDEKGEKVLVPGMSKYEISDDQKVEDEREVIRENQDYFVREKLPGSELDKPKAISEIKHFRAAVNEMYFNAKNNVYTKANYYNELSEIQDRTDFSRSLTLLCLVFFLAYGLFSGMSFKEKWRLYLDIDPKEKKSLVALTVIYLFGILVAGIAYRSEASSHDRRVFGYYISMVLDQERTPSGPNKTRDSD